MEENQKERSELLGDPEDFQRSDTPEYTHLDDDISEISESDHEKKQSILYKFIPLKGVILNGDIRLLADHINKHGFNRPERKAFINLMFGKHFEASILLIKHLSPKKIAHKTENVEHAGRTLTTCIYKARTKYKKHHEKDKEKTAKTLINNNHLEKISIDMTTFCGKMYRADIKMRKNAERQCTIL